MYGFFFIYSNSPLQKPTFPLQTVFTYTLISQRPATVYFSLKLRKSHNFLVYHIPPLPEEMGELLYNAHDQKRLFIEHLIYYGSHSIFQLLKPIIPIMNVVDCSMIEVYILDVVLKRVFTIFRRYGRTTIWK